MITDAAGIYEVMQDTGFAAKFIGDVKLLAAYEHIIAQFLVKPIRTFIATIPANRLGNKRVVGYSIIAPAWKQTLSLPAQFQREGYAYSKGVGVLNEFKRKKVGESLAIFTANEAQNEGYHGIYTDAASDNAASIAFQIQLGMKEIARVPDKKRPSGILSVWFVKNF